MTIKKFFNIVFPFLLALMACNLPSGMSQNAPNEDEPNAEENTQNTPPEVNPTFTPIPVSPTPEFTATPEFTPTPTIPMASVSVNTNCRTGPSVEYDLLSGLNVGQFAEVVGKSTATGYWIIKTPGGVGNCWLWGEYATISGNTANLPEFPVPPTPTPSVPSPVSNFNANVACVFVNNPYIHNKVTVNLTWSDTSTNEEGFRLFSDGNLLVTLGANSTNYVDNTTLPAIWLIGNPPPSIIYEIRTFNSAGASNKVSVKVQCP